MDDNFLSSFKINIDLNKIYPVYYISGSNSWLKQKSFETIIENINKIKKNCQIYKFDEENFIFKDFIELCESIPMGADFKCIIVKDWELDKLNNKELDFLISMFLDMASFCCVIIYNLNLSIAKSKINKLINVIKKVGMIIETVKPMQSNIINFIISKIKADNLIISYKTAILLSEYCNNDLNKISQEIDKLSAFCKDREIFYEDIKKIVLPTLEVRVFDLLKFINARDKRRGILKLNELLDNKEDPIMIISIISMNFLDIYRAKLAKQYNKTPADILNIFDYKGKEFRVNKAFLSSNQYSFNQLNHIFDLLLRADLKLKTSSISKRFILQNLISKIFLLLEEV